MSEQKRLAAIVHGRVQGVSFRYNTQIIARELGLTGWVRNRPDGTVEVVAEGAATALAEFETWLHRGPRAAVVRRVALSWQPPSGEFSEFKVRF